MIDIITKSKVRQNILKLLFADPQRELYLSEIAKKIKASIGNCRRELDKMVKAGILKTKKKGNLVLYAVNRQGAIYDELATIIHKTIGPEIELKKLIKEIGGVKFAFIFGSYLKKDFSANSDLDLFLIGQVDENKLVKKIRPLEDALDREINYHLYREKDFKAKVKQNSFLRNISKNQLFLTDNKNEFTKLLK